MKISDIDAMWEIDCVIDPTELGVESLKIPRLHFKYQKIYSPERLFLQRLETELKTLRLQKKEFYMDGPTQETHDAGWKLPPKGRILRVDVQEYIDADQDIIALSLRIGQQREKVDKLESIIKSFSNRGFHIRAAIDDMKFKNGF